MWILQEAGHNFGLATAEWRVQLFRALFGLACLWKFAETFRHGGWHRFEPGTYGRHQLVRRRGALGERVARAYRCLAVLRCLPALGVLLGVLTRPCLVLVVACLLVELVYDPRKHPVYFIVNACCLLVAGSPGALFHFGSVRTTANSWAQCLIALTTWHMYWNSAWVKLRSAQFRSGRALAQLAHLASRLRGTVKYREYCLPEWAWRPFNGGTEADVRRWRVLSGATIVMEVLLPVGLVAERSYVPFFVMGAGMHAVFTFLKPRALIPFSLVTVASYLAFIP